MAARSRPARWSRSPHLRIAHEIERCGIAAWLEETADMPVRVLCAPIGSGKTIAALQYVERRNGAAAYVHVPDGVDAPTLRALIGASAADEVVLDELDRADGTACDALREDIQDGLVAQRLIVVGRSRRRLRVHGLVARGSAAACEPAAFAFDDGELTALAVTTGVDGEPEDVTQLLEDTDGWPLAAHWVLRDARAAKLVLSEAFAAWRERSAHLLFEFLQHERNVDADAYETFTRMLVDGWDGGHYELERLEQLGLPILRESGVLRPYRILVKLAVGEVAPAQPLTCDELPHMRLDVLGRFRCEVVGRPVSFARRRDQQVFVFVATAPEGRTSRDRVLDAFWPGIERTAAKQSLRVTLSRIRRAIVEAAPAVSPDRYFRTVGDLSIDARVVAVDVRRFVDHVEQGRLDDAGGNLNGAKHHYRAAHRIYADRLLASEGTEPCLVARVADFESFYEEALNRLMSLYAATGELETARAYARELLSREGHAARGRALELFAGAAPGATA